MMTQPTVDEIVSLLREFPISEISIEQDGQSIKAVSGPNTYVKPVEVVVSPTPPASIEQESALREEKSLFVTSTMVGHFHMPSPPLKFGSEITTDQFVGAIESIKVMNDVLSQVEGLLVETLVDDGAPVEYGQPLYRLN